MKWFHPVTFQSYFIGNEQFGQEQYNLYHCISSSSRHAAGQGGSSAQSSVTISGHSQPSWGRIRHLGNRFKCWQFQLPLSNVVQELRSQMLCRQPNEKLGLLRLHVPGEQAR